MTKKKALSHSQLLRKCLDELPTRITAHVEAQVELSWAGGGDPADRPLIEAYANVAELELDQTMRKLRELLDLER